MNKFGYFLISALTVLYPTSVLAEIVLPQIYTDNMVLQRCSLTDSSHRHFLQTVQVLVD